MKKYLKKIIKDVLNEIFEDKMGRIVNLSAETTQRGLFAYIGIQRLKEIIKEIEESKDRKDTYTSLSELYSRTMRKNLSKENSEIIHSYYELLPKLNDYKEKLNEVIKN